MFRRILPYKTLCLEYIGVFMNNNLENKRKSYVFDGWCSKVSKFLNVWHQFALDKLDLFFCYFRSVPTKTCSVVGMHHKLIRKYRPTTRVICRPFLGFCIVTCDYIKWYKHSWAQLTSNVASANRQQLTFSQNLASANRWSLTPD